MEVALPQALLPGSTGVPLSQSEIDAMLASAASHRFAAGEVIEPARSGARRVHYIRSGRARVLIHGPADGQDKIVAILEAGALIGDIYALGGRRSVSVYASEDTKTWSWKAETFLGFVVESKVATLYVLRSMAAKVRLLTSQIETLSFCRAADRIIGTFANLADIYGQSENGAVRIPIRLTQAEIGEMANVSRVSVSKVCARLRQQGVLEKRRGFFLVLDPVSLQQLAGIPARATTALRSDPEATA